MQILRIVIEFEIGLNFYYFRNLSIKEIYHDEQCRQRLDVLIFYFLVMGKGRIEGLINKI